MTTVSYNDRSPKYPAIASMTGSILGGRMADCPHGLIVNRMIVAAHPRPEPEQRVFLNRSYVALGIDASCREPGLAAAGKVAATRRE